MSKHTPGPWIAVKGIFWSVENEQGYRIANLVESENIGLPPNDDSEANSSLIAAAPDFLQALIEISNTTLDYDNGTGHSMIEIARKAIARYQGDQS